MSPGFLFSNFPPVELSSEGARASNLENFGEKANIGTQRWGEQPGAYGQQDILGQYSAFGQFRTNSGQPGPIGQSASRMQPQTRFNPLPGNMRERENAVNFGLQNMVKLPRLELKRFIGDPMKWLEFWENFERNVHDNQGYSDVHKMSYLKAYLDGPASTTIANLSIIGDNYKPAIAILKEKYGPTGLLKEAHMAAFKATQGVSNARDVNKLRKFYDDVDSHYKALSILGVPGEHYSVAVVPKLMGQVPRDVAINIRRSKDVNHEWMIGEFLDKLWQELVIRSASESQDQPVIERRREGRVLSVNSISCVYCLGEHQSRECSQVKDPDKRKDILRKYNRCFQCLRKGHPQRKCRDERQCDKCKKTGHRTSICRGETTPNLHVAT